MQNAFVDFFEIYFTHTITTSFPTPSILRRLRPCGLKNKQIIPVDFAV